MQRIGSRRARVTASLVLAIGGVTAIGAAGVTSASATGARAPASLRLGHGVAYPFLHARQGASAAATQPQLRYYGGTPDPVKRIGVQVHAKVYLVFWGAQWGTPTKSG